MYLLVDNIGAINPKEVLGTVNERDTEYYVVRNSDQSISLIEKTIPFFKLISIDPVISIDTH